MECCKDSKPVKFYKKGEPILRCINCGEEQSDST